MGVGLGLSGAAEEALEALLCVERDRDRWSGSTAVEPSFGKVVDQLEDPITDIQTAQNNVTSSYSEGGAVGAATRAMEDEDQVEDDLFEEDAEEAKVNRKVADLEISNASLMAINRSLEGPSSL
jgi:hypothetical protein